MYKERTSYMNKTNDSNNYDTYIQAITTGLSSFHDKITEAFAPLITAETFEYLSHRLESFSTEMTNNIIDLDLINKSLLLFSDYLTTYDFSSLINNIVIEEDCVILSDNAVETITKILNEDKTTSISKVSSKTTIKNFIYNTLLPLLSILIPIFQTAYYHKLDTLESQQDQMQETEFQEALLKLETQQAKELENLNNTINELLDHLESSQDSDLTDIVVPLPTPDVQEKPSESPVVVTLDIDTPDSYDNNLQSK